MFKLIPIILTFAALLTTAPAQAVDPTDSEYSQSGNFTPENSRVADTFGSLPNLFLSFDDGSSELTLKLLDVLDLYPEVKVTFFVNCRETVPGTFQRIIDSGHAIGNHTCDHPYMTKLSSSERITQMTSLDDFVTARVTDISPISCWRPPFGAVSDSVRWDLAPLGLKEWLWSADPADWSKPGVDAITAELATMQDGEVVVLHDSRGKEQTVEAVRRFLSSHSNERIFRTLPGCGLSESEKLPWDAGPACVGPYPCSAVGSVSQTGEFRLRSGLGTDGGVTSEFYFGNPGDVPLMGDWDCDGIDTPGQYRQSDGYVYLRNSNTQGVADIRFFFGNPGDIPLVGDFNGDGCDVVALYRSSEAKVYLTNQLGFHNQGLGKAELSFYFGAKGDKPFAGDWNGDGIDTVGLHRESSGEILLRNSNVSGVADWQFYFGNPGDVIVSGDWKGDGIDEVGAYRPKTGTWYLKTRLDSGKADHAFRFEPWAVPVSGNFK